MAKSNIVKIICLVMLVIAGIFLLMNKASNKTAQKKEIPQVEIMGHTFNLEIADDQEKRSRGLGYRDSLCEDCGMLFVFPQPGQYGFWMKGMRFPLDIIWISGDKITYIAKNVTPDFSRTISPKTPADKVLEINAGLCEKFGIAEGSSVSFK
jgi:uncharacterized protein